TEAIGTLGVGGFLGMLTGPYLGDLLLSGERTQEVFERLFLAATVTLVVPATLVSLLPAVKTGSEVRTVRARDFIGSVRTHWPGVVLLANLCFGVCLSIPFGFLSSFVDKVSGTASERSYIGLFFLGYAGLGATLRLGLRRVPDRVGPERVLLAGLLLFAVGTLSFLLVRPGEGWLVILPGLLCGAGHGLTFHTMASLTLRTFPAKVGGTGSALTLMSVDLGTIAGSPILGSIAEERGYHWMFICLSVTCVVVAVTYAIAMRETLRLGPRREPAATSSAAK
ncbi:MAG: MFS transporter, partial [Planctomycetota bacterium]